MKILVFFSFFFLATSAYSQENSKYKTEIVAGNGPFSGAVYPTTLLTDTLQEPLLKSKFKDYIIKQINFQPTEYFYWKYLKKEIDYDFLQSILARSHSDTSLLTKKFVAQGIKILVGETREGRKCFVADMNRNDLFSDDSICYYDEDLKINEIPALKAEIEVYFDGRIQTKTIYFKVYPLKSGYKYGEPKENEFYLLAYSYEHRLIYFKAGSEEYELLLSNEMPSVFYSANNTKILLRKFKQSENREQFRIGDSISIDSYTLVVRSISPFGDEINMDIIKTDKQMPHGYQIDQRAIEINAKEISGSQLKLSGFKGKYVLLDFWGTWCVPCKENTPKIKELYRNSSRKKFEILGIASDDDSIKVKKYIKQQGIKWPNIFDNAKESTICKNYNVKIFPTYILIDDTGKIALREEGIDGINKISAFMKGKQTRR